MSDWPILDKTEKDLARRAHEGIKEKAFAELQSYLSDQGLDYRSLVSLKDADPKVCRKAAEFCLKKARSNRFSQERMFRLRSLRDFLNSIDTSIYRYICSLVAIGGFGIGSQREIELFLANCADANYPIDGRIVEEQFYGLRSSISTELEKQNGFLALARELITYGKKRQ